VRPQYWTTRARAVLLDPDHRPPQKIDGHQISVMLEMELPYRFFQTKFAKAQPGIRPNCFKQAEATTQRTLGNYE
jgi:hypothetical protein